MKNSTFRIENILPILSVKDMGVSKSFYVEKLGFKEAEWGSEQFTCVTRDGSGIYLCKDGQGNPGTWIWIGFDGDIYSLFDELKTNGVIIQQEPVNYSWALELRIEDPDGHIIRLGKEPDTNKPFADRIAK